MNPQTKTVYSYHPDTGEYVGTTQADLSPLETDVWLCPAHTTETPPPNSQANQAAVYKNGRWKMVADWRQAKLWDTKTAQPVPARLGDTPESLNATELAPPEHAVWQGSQWGVDSTLQLAAQRQAAKAQLQSKLAELQALRQPLEDAEALDMATDAELTKLKALKKYGVLLNRLPLHKNWPNLQPEDWPPKPE